MWDKWLLPITLALTAVVVVRCMVGMSMQIHWDVDPRSDAAQVESIVLGPAGTAWLNTLSVTVAGLALMGHVLAGGTLRWLSITLAALGSVICVVQAPQHVDNLLRGMSWITAVWVAVAALHLGSRPLLRQWMCGALVAMLVSMFLHALLYVWLEHPQTVDMFRENKMAFLAARGWEIDSPQHLAYERRLGQPDVAGVFALSNVFGSIVMSLTLIALGAALGVLRHGWRRALVPASLTLVGFSTVYLTQSKGAAAALMMGTALVVLVCWLPRFRWSKHLVVSSAVLLVMLAVGVVLVRGVLGAPPAPQHQREVQGERSLLFRFYYWQGALRMVLDDPLPRAALGVGPGGFQDLYMRLKNPLSPEEVISAHNVFVDFVTMLGVGGWAWFALLMIWLGQAGHSVAAPCDAKNANFAAGRITKLDLYRALALAGMVFGTQFFFHRLVLPAPERFMAWLIGVASMMAIAGLWVAPGWWTRRGTDIGLFAGAVALLIHNQIEMAFFTQGATVVVWFIVALAAARQVEQGLPKPDIFRRSLRWRLLAAIALLVGSIAMAVGYALPVSRQEKALAAAAENLQQGDMRSAINLVETAITALPTNPRPYRSETRLLVEAAGYLMRLGRHNQARQAINDAFEMLDNASGYGLDTIMLLRLRAKTHESAASILGEPHHLVAALNHWLRVIARNPNGLQDHLHLADLQWTLKQYDDARYTYRTCLKLSDQAYLDPLRQLSNRDRQRIEARLESDPSL